MNNNDILNKYIDLIDKGYCCACNELNCIDNFPQTKITHAIRKLQQENKKQKEIIDETTNAIDLVIELIKQQPTEDDRWILDRLNGFKIILENKEVSE